MTLVSLSLSLYIYIYIYIYMYIFKSINYFRYFNGDYGY